jgi:hypothetical protein
MPVLHIFQGDATMKRLQPLSSALLAAFALCLLTIGPLASPAHARAVSPCGFSDGFQALREQIGAEIVGDCLYPPQAVAGGNVEQRASGGLLVWEKRTNLVAFTDGHQTWLMGPNGVERRLNAEQFEWEKELRAQLEITPLKLAQLYVEAVRGRVDVNLEHIYAEAYVMAMRGLSTWAQERKVQFQQVLSGGLLPVRLSWMR